MFFSFFVNLSVTSKNSALFQLDIFKSKSSYGSEGEKLFLI